MARIVVCADCGEEKKHKAKGLCNTCYMRQYKRRIAVCEGCGERKEHQAKGLCEPCYKQEHYEEHRKEIAIYKQHYYQAHRKQELTRATRWQEKNRERRAIYMHQYYQNHREAHRDRGRRWREENPEKVIAIEARRRAHKAKVANTLTQEEIEFEMSIAKSMWPSEDLHLHHIIPISKGGGHTWGNIMVIPASLNCSIGDRLPRDIYKQLELAQCALP